MNKTIHSLLFVSLSAVATASAQAADTSGFFTGETSTTLSKGAVSFDLEYDFNSNAAPVTSLRTGALGGEIMLNSASDAHSGFAASSVGYKRSLGKSFSAYGIISYYDDGLPAATSQSATNTAVGGAYTMKVAGLTLNVNPEFVTDDCDPAPLPAPNTCARGGKSTLFIKGLAAYKIKSVPVSIVAEIVLDNNSLVERNVNLGVRWQPKKDLTVDFIIYHDDGAPANDPVIAIPGYVIVNYLF